MNNHALPYILFRLSSVSFCFLIDININVGSLQVSYHMRIQMYRWLNTKCSLVYSLDVVQDKVYAAWHFKQANVYVQPRLTNKHFCCFDF